MKFIVSWNFEIEAATPLDAVRDAACVVPYLNENDDYRQKLTVTNARTMVAVEDFNFSDERLWRG